MKKQGQCCSISTCFKMLSLLDVDYLVVYRFQRAIQVEIDMKEAFEKNDFETTNEIYTSVRPVIDQVLNDEALLQ